MMKNLYIPIALLTVLILSSCAETSAYIKERGAVFGTFYQVSYDSPNGETLKAGVDSVLNSINSSLSNFDPNSVVSKVNMNKKVELDHNFITVFKKAEEVSKVSNGAFDVTVSPLVNAWGFGFKNKEHITDQRLDSLLNLVGYEKVALVDGKIQKQEPGTMLDFSSIAKGYGVDAVANYLHLMGCNNFMVDIGGEIVCKGVNDKGEVWNIGISTPDEDNLDNHELQAILHLKDKAMATSGNYRNFYVEDGKKYAHTINPLTGYPVQKDILSATILADDCMTADAYATSCMVLGLNEALKLIDKTPNVEAYFICSDSSGNYITHQTPGFKALFLD